MRGTASCHELWQQIGWLKAMHRYFRHGDQLFRDIQILIAIQLFKAAS
jgi:hypothetical protein